MSKRCIFKQIFDMNNTSIAVNKDYDLICVGGGIMSATLALMAKILKPELNILIFERLDEVARESSAAWNNAGTGHSALCELNYTPEQEDGSIDVTKALKIFNQFEISKQFWAYLVEQGMIAAPSEFINKISHHSWVTGAENVAFLGKRYETLKQHPMFQSMQFTKDIEVMKQWFPLIAHDRTEADMMAATRMEHGAEMNFGALTKKMFQILEDQYDTPVHCYKEVLDVDPDDGVDWTVIVRDLQTRKKQYFDAEHVFIGAGGGALLLLQKVEIKEKEGYGGFPVSGQWLVCKKEEIIEQHHAKVYTKAGPDAPPMSTPHLDTRYVDGKKALLFGPFAGFSPKFLKEGSNFDLFKSVTYDNMPAMWGAFWHNMPLTAYLIRQVSMNHEDRMEELRKFMKNAKSEDWELEIAGQRVQIIKKDAFEGGQLRFGTEVVHSENGSITCLLGASPGASTAVHVMLEVLELAFPEIVHSDNGKQLLQSLVPTWKIPFDEALFQQHFERSNGVLGV